MFGSENKKIIAELRKELSHRSAQLSFQYAQSDPNLLQSLLGTEPVTPDSRQNLQAIYQKIREISFGMSWALDQEVEVIREFLKTTESSQQRRESRVHLKVADGVELKELKALTLFPLIQNAVMYGFDSPQAQPINVKVTSNQSIIQLEVSNQVNPYLTNQAETDIFQAFHQGLDWFYPDAAELLYNSNSNRFKATLIIR